MHIVRYILVLLTVFSLAACEDANPVTDVSSLFSGGSASLSPEQRDLRQRENAYRNARLQAAGLGALAGLGAGLALNRSAEETAVLTAAGAAGGYYAGAALTRQNASFQTAQSVLQRDIQNARADTERLERSVASAQSTLNYQRGEIARLNQGLAGGTVSASDYQARYRTMQGDLAATQDLRQAAQTRVDGLRQSIAGYRSKGVSTGQLNTELSRQQSRLSQLQAIERSMVSTLNTVPGSVRGS